MVIFYRHVKKKKKKKKKKIHPDVVDYFIELPFYNKHIEKPNIKHLKNIDLLSELSFYEEMNRIKTNHAFGGNATSYKVELIEKTDPTEQLEASNSSVKDLFSDLLDETKGFKYQLTLKVVLKNSSQMEKLNLEQFIVIQ